MGHDSRDARAVLGALDAALTQHLCHLFGVLMSDPSEDGSAALCAG